MTEHWACGHVTEHDDADGKPEKCPRCGCRQRVVHQHLPPPLLTERADG